MPKTVQIRDIDDEVYAALVRRAGEAGITVPELLRREAARLAARPSVAQWLARTGRRLSWDAGSRADGVVKAPRSGVEDLDPASRPVCTREPRIQRQQCRIERLR